MFSIHFLGLSVGLISSISSHSSMFGNIYHSHNMTEIEQPVSTISRHFTAELSQVEDFHYGGFDIWPRTLTLTSESLSYTIRLLCMHNTRLVKSAILVQLCKSGGTSWKINRSCDRGFTGRMAHCRQRNEWRLERVVYVRWDNSESKVVELRNAGMTCCERRYHVHHKNNRKVNCRHTPGEHFQRRRTTSDRRSVCSWLIDAEAAFPRGDGQRRGRSKGQVRSMHRSSDAHALAHPNFSHPRCHWSQSQTLPTISRQFTPRAGTQQQHSCKTSRWSPLIRA